MNCFNPVRLLSFTAARRAIWSMFDNAAQVHTGWWQGVKIDDQPAGRMFELMNVNLHVPQAPANVERLQRDLETSANFPWAEDHFQERVCGAPINPGTEWANWPDGKSAARFLNSAGQFNHNYMERYWPKHAGHSMAASKTVEEFLRGNQQYNELDPLAEPHFGIRGEFGDLNDLLNLLEKDPLTRQAYMPIYFPEDLALPASDRKPCTLGYQFMVRQGRMHIYYPMRSCDFYRHWGDDCYLTVRLGLWIIDELRQRDSAGPWRDINIGSFTMHCTSLHMFVNDYAAERTKR